MRRFCATVACSAIVEKGHCAQHEKALDRDRPNADIRRLYHTARWRHPVWGRRAQTLLKDPLCKECMAEGRYEPSTEVDHVIRHGNSIDAFWHGELQGLCARHHSEKTGKGQ